MKINYQVIACSDPNFPHAVQHLDTGVIRALFRYEDEAENFAIFLSIIERK